MGDEWYICAHNPRSLQYLSMFYRVNMLFQRPLVAACLLIRAALAITLCSSADSTYAGSWPRIPWDCADESHDKLSILGVGTPLSSIETGESEVLLGRFRYYMTRSNPHFAKISVILSSKHMDLYWTPDGDKQGSSISKLHESGLPNILDASEEMGISGGSSKMGKF